MTFNNWFGWDYVEQCYAEYDKGLVEVEPIGGLYEPTRSKSMLAFPAHCAATREQAFAEVRPVAEGILAVVIQQYLALAAGGGKDYAYLKQMKELEAHQTDIEYVIQMSPGILIGTPDDCIERIKQYEKLGADEV
ncbi:MAG: LLM class flavin-dependent oxidoreductase, partial [Candidatus Binatia bacterium]